MRAASVALRNMENGVCSPVGVCADEDGGSACDQALDCRHNGAGFASAGHAQDQRVVLRCNHPAHRQHMHFIDYFAGLICTKSRRSRPLSWPVPFGAFWCVIYGEYSIANRITWRMYLEFRRSCMGGLIRSQATSTEQRYLNAQCKQQAQRHTAGSSCPAIHKLAHTLHAQSLIKQRNHHTGQNKTGR